MSITDPPQADVVPIVLFRDDREAEWIVSPDSLHVASIAGSELVLTGRLQAGLFAMSMCTKDGGYDVDTARISLTEWPSGKSVKCGPFDLDHTKNVMAVPTFSVTANGTDCGLVWCEVPGVEDEAKGRIRAEWGLGIETAGDVEIRLTLSPVSVSKLRWDNVAQISLEPDDRYSLPVLPTQAHKQPVLFAADADFARWGADPNTTEKALIERLQAMLVSERDGTYDYRTTTLALMSRVLGDESLGREAIDRVLALCDQEQWGYHDIPGIMGWNNDRDCGDRMMECALVLTWLRDQLSADETKRLVEKLAYHLRIVEQVTTLQRSYWYYRSNEAHGQGLWSGLLAAATALLPYHERAATQLEWGLGNLDDALRRLPADGVVEWPVFNARWHLRSLALVERLLGRRLADDGYPAIDAMAGSILGFEPATGHSELGVMLFFLAHRNQDPVTQADAFRALGLENPAQLEDGSSSPFSLLYYDRHITPSTPRPVPQSARSLGGSVCCHSRSGAQFHFQCGSPLSEAEHDSHNWIAQTWYGPGRSGSFSWRTQTDGVLTPYVLKGYRKRTADANLLTVDGKGHHCDGRWLSGRIPRRWLSRIETYERDEHVTWCRANLAPAYTDDAGVLTYWRSWLHCYETGIVLMVDDVTLTRPRDLAWNVHAKREPWERLALGYYQTSQGSSDWRVRLLASDTGSPQDVTITRQQPQWVPSYTFGINGYLSSRWQPEFNRAAPDVPVHQRLTLAPATPTSRWRLLTAMTADDQDLSLLSGDWGAQGIAIALPSGSQASYHDGNWTTSARF